MACCCHPASKWLAREMIRIQNTVSVDCVLLLHYNAKKKKLSLTVESEEGGREGEKRERVGVETGRVLL